MRRLRAITAAAAMAAVMGIGGSAGAIDLQDGLVGYWPTDVNGADPTDDASPLNNVGTLGATGAVETDDPAYECDAADIAPTFGNTCSLEFTKADVDLVTVARDVSLEPAAFTLSAWIKTSLAARQRVITKVHDAAAKQSYSLNIDPVGQPELRMEQNGGGTNVAVSSVSVDDGVWHHIAGVFDPTDAGFELKIFVDGVPVGTDAKTFAIPFYDTTAAGVLFLGGWAGIPTQFMDGLIDESRIYDRVLAVAEIEILASGGALPDPYADEVASFVLPIGGGINDCLVAGGFCDTTLDDNDQGADALEAPDSTDHGGSDGTVSSFTSLGYNSDTGDGGILTLNFTDNTCLDGNGNDIKIYEVSHGETFDVEIGIQGGSLANIDIDVNGTTSEAGLSADGVTPFNQVRLEATSGGAAGVDGPDIDAAECLNTLDFGTAHIEKAFAVHGEDEDDPNEIFQVTRWNGIDEQYKAFEITITNNTGIDGGLSDLIFFDVVPAEWDLDDMEEDEVNGCGENSEVCDGVDVVAADGNLTDCTATGVEHTNSGKSGKAQLQPELITITADGLGNGDSCTIKVWVVTDKAHKKTFTPTSCPVTLNDGVEVLHDTLTPGVVTSEDVLLFIDDDSLVFDDGAGTDGFCNEPS